MRREQVARLIYDALRRYQASEIDDVTHEADEEDPFQIVLTTEDPDTDEFQTWVIDSVSIRETDPPDKES